jgi:hypothetical protein
MLKYCFFASVHAKKRYGSAVEFFWWSVMPVWNVAPDGHRTKLELEKASLHSIAVTVTNLVCTEVVEHNIHSTKLRRC